MVIYISSSISNFREKLQKRMDVPYANIWNVYKPAIFFGLYHKIDYIKFLAHRGKKKVFWTGGDIKNLKHNKNKKWQERIANADAEHYCENEVEQRVLMSMKIFPDVYPMIFTETDNTVTFQKNTNPHIYMTAHAGREKEYGVDILRLAAVEFPNYRFHIYGLQGEVMDNLDYGILSENDFNEVTKDYQCAVRLNRFDGFSETVAKAVLRGQYAITTIEYPEIAYANSLESFMYELDKIQYKTTPNYQGRDYWIKELEESKWKLLS